MRAIGDIQAVKTLNNLCAFFPIPPYAFFSPSFSTQLSTRFPCHLSFPTLFPTLQPLLSHRYLNQMSFQSSKPLYRQISQKHPPVIQRPGDTLSAPTPYLNQRTTFCLPLSFRETFQPACQPLFPHRQSMHQQPAHKQETLKNRLTNLQVTLPAPFSPSPPSSQPPHEQPPLFSLLSSPFSSIGSLPTSNQPSQATSSTATTSKTTVSYLKTKRDTHL